MEVFTSAEDDKLISLVSQYPFLYDVSLPLFRNAFKRLKAWDEIGVKLNKSGRGCKNRWRNIKDTYFRQKKKLATKQSLGGHPRSKFEKYKKKLAFLEEVTNQSVPGVSNNDEPAGNNDENSNSTMDSDAHSPANSEIIIFKEECDSENEAIEVRQDDQNTDNEQWDFAGYKSSTEPTENPESSTIKRKAMTARKRQMMLKNRQRITRQKLNSATRKEDDDDEINLFTRQANSVLRKLPSYHQIKAMQEMFEILTKYKILAAESSTSEQKRSANDPLYDC